MKTSLPATTLALAWSQCLGSHAAIHSEGSEHNYKSELQERAVLRKDIDANQGDAGCCRSKKIVPRGGERR